jgi:hypothetical protein
MREVKAVRMVVVGMWQWQYWRSCDGLNRHEKKMAVAVAVADFGASCGPMSGSVWVAVVSFDARGHGVSNGGGWDVTVAVLAEL